MRVGMVYYLFINKNKCKLIKLNAPDMQSFECHSNWKDKNVKSEVQIIDYLALVPGPS